MPIPAHNHVFYDHGKDYHFSDVVKHEFQSGSSDNVAIHLQDSFQFIEIMHNRVLSFYGQSSHVDILEDIGREERLERRKLYLVKAAEGFNFDCVLSFDVIRADDETYIFDCIFASCPVMVVMAQQCSGLANWCQFSRMMNLEAHKCCHQFASLNTLCANLQHGVGRHWFPSILPTVLCLWNRMDLHRTSCRHNLMLYE